MQLAMIGREDGEAPEPEAVTLKRPSSVYAGGAKSQRIEAPSVSNRQKNQIKRGGAGKHSFKSKAKHKRRK